MMRDSGEQSALPDRAASAGELGDDTAVQLQRVLQLNTEIQAHYRSVEDTIVTVRTALSRVAAGDHEVPDEEPKVEAHKPVRPIRAKRRNVIMATLACAALCITTGLIVSLQAATPKSVPAGSTASATTMAITAEQVPAKLQDYGQTIYAARFHAAPPAERTCLARAVYYEARGEATDGQIAVAQVILNRARSKQWPSTICGVVNQGVERGEKCQFSFACFTNLSAPVGQLWEQAKSIADEAVAGRGWLRELVEATHYHATGVAPVWRLNLTPIDTIGAHVFYRGNDGIVASSKDADGYRAAAAAQTVQDVHQKIAAFAKATTGIKVSSLIQDAPTDKGIIAKPARAKLASDETGSALVPKRVTPKRDADWKASVFQN